MQHGVTRTIRETNFSPRKESKRQKNLSAPEAENALESVELKAMLTDQRPVLAAMGDYVSDLMELKTDEKDPRKLLKMLLLEGWIDEKGRITNKDSELTLVWKEVRRFNAQQSMNMIKNLNPDIEKTKFDVVEATSVEELVTATNKSLKLTETVLIAVLKQREGLMRLSRSRSEPISRTST